MGQPRIVGIGLRRERPIEASTVSTQSNRDRRTSQPNGTRYGVWQI
ncbi:hypothetical protein J5X98_13810 [Leptothermofonsia sichuanensis E412]|nr:hypothetical protein [Leptothermofonsia sichuanensis]QZZ18571.1 hypothetical protein J5X98_13810 [Leptothermofonsia sichuanensis E412]